MPKRRSSPRTTARRITALEKKLDLMAEHLPPKRGEGWFHQAARAVEAFSLTRLLAAAGAWLVFFTVITFWFDFNARTEEREARAEEAEFRKLAQVATAWELLLTRAGGDIGKGNAVNTILAAQGQLSGADLSCENAGVFHDGNCIARPQYNGMILGDGDFWKNDKERDICRDSSCYTRSYLSRTNFEDAEISSLMAEKLLLDQNFNGVIGRNWIVRNGYSGTGYRSEYIVIISDDAPEFGCVNCWFFGGILSWRSVSGFYSSTFESTFIELPANEDVMPAEGWNFETFLDNPVVFYRRGLEDAIMADRHGSSSKPVDIMSFVDWTLYKRGTYCVDKDDLQSLWPHIEALIEAKDAEVDAPVRKDTQNSELKQEAQLNDSYRTPSLKSKHSSLEQAYLALSLNNPAAQFRATRKDAVLTSQIAYDCTYGFSEVEPLLRQRVAKRLASETWN